MSNIQQNSFLRGPAPETTEDEESYRRFCQARAREDAEEDERVRRQIEKTRERKYASEYAAFKAFEVAEKKRILREAAEAKAEAERVASAAENARLRAAELARQEQAKAVELAKSMIEDAFTRNYYGRPDRELIEIGVRLKGGLNSLTYPNALLQLWRNQRYQGKVEQVNMRNRIGPPPPGLDYDGLPSLDQADEDTKRILNTEWDKWLCYCRRFADRFSEGTVPSEQEKRINDLIQENKRVQTALDETVAKIEKSRQAFASTFA
jgi:hypothetical protein